MQLPDMKEARHRTKNDVSIKYDYDLTDEEKVLGLGKTYFVKTYGCQMNEHDSENIRAILEQMGYTASSDI